MPEYVATTQSLCVAESFVLLFPRRNPLVLQQQHRHHLFGIGELTGARLSWQSLGYCEKLTRSLKFAKEEIACICQDVAAAVAAVAAT